MLSADLVRARRRGEKLLLSKLTPQEKDEALAISTGLLAVVTSSLGSSFEELNEDLAAVPRSAKHEKLWAGLKKLVLDECEFGSPVEVDPTELRKSVFELASSMRRDVGLESELSRDTVFKQVAERFGISPEQVEEALFSDLKGAALLTKVPQSSPEALVGHYEVGQIQGILLKAVRLKVQVECGGPDQARAFFRKLKFRRLLYRLRTLDGGRYEVEIEGPFSMFESVTKYGLSLALMVPALLECKSAHLRADLRWGKERKELVFEADLPCWGGPQDSSLELRSEVKVLLGSLQKRTSSFEVTAADELLEVPGAGLCVPDLKFVAPDRPPVFLEVLGFWSREAVFQRVEWAQQQADARVLFAVSSKLRVKKEVLDDRTGSGLYVYKGTMSAAAVLAQVEELSRRS